MCCTLSIAGIDYTVINPGGLTDRPGGERELLVGKKDGYLDSDTRMVPRGDVARVSSQLTHNSCCM